MDRSTTLQGVRNTSPFMEGDILQSDNGDKAVVVQVLASVTHQEVYYRLNWDSEGNEELIPLRATGDMEIVGEMERPYNWR